MFEKYLYLRIWSRVALLLLLVTQHLAVSSQQRIGFSLPEGAKKVEIPFETYNNLVVIPLTINGVLKLKFIIDSGAESAILTEKVFADVLGLSYVREITIQAPGVIASLSAYVATGISIGLPGGVIGEGLNMLVLKDDYLELSKNLGEKVYGIIGYDVFNRFVMSFDYDENILTLYKPEYYKPSRFRTTALPMKIEGTKAFVEVSVSQNGRYDSLKLMVDTGASHALLLDAGNSNTLRIPKDVIATRLGQGLGGEIPGLLGRISAFQIGDMRFEKVLSSFPIEGAYSKAIKRGSRHGTLGGDILSRLHVTFDYTREIMYIKKGKKYKDSFDYNMSGMFVKAEGEDLDKLVISKILPNTPAAECGLQEGDEILKIRHKNLQNSSISEINSLLRKRNGLKIPIVIRRDGEKIKKLFYLKRMI